MLHSHVLQDRSLRRALELVAEQRPGISPNAGDAWLHAMSAEHSA